VDPLRDDITTELTRKTSSLQVVPSTARGSPNMLIRVRRQSMRKDMAAHAWVRPLGQDSVARVTLDATQGSRERRYRVEFPFVVGGSSAEDVLVTGAGNLDHHHLRARSGLPTSELVVSVPAAADLERLVVRARGDRFVIHLPSTRLLDACHRVVEGDLDGSASAVIDAFRSPVQIPLVCGSFLELDEVLRLVEGVVRHDRYVQSMLHSYRYAIVRSALVSKAGLHVGTYRALVQLVNGLDAISEIGAVSLVHALGDVVGTVHGTPDDTLRLLDSLGLAFDALDAGNDGLFTTVFLAHLACTEGVEAAERYEVPTKLPPRGHYDRRKRGVFMAGYGDRGRAWRRLLNAARRESPVEVGKVLAHTLYWTGEEARDDSRTTELLLRGAAAVAAHASLYAIEHKARFKRHLAAGHRLRGTHCWGPSMANFEAARGLARDNPFLNEWEPVLSWGIVASRRRSVAGDHEGALRILDRTIEDLLATAPPTSVANRSVRHVEAQKCEIESLLYRTTDPARARALLEQSRRFYDAIGFERSCDKIDRMLARLPERPAVDEPTVAPIAESERPPAVGDEAAWELAPEVTAAARQRGVPPEELDDDWLEHIEYPDERDPERTFDEPFEDPYVPEGVGETSGRSD